MGLFATFSLGGCAEHPPSIYSPVTVEERHMSVVPQGQDSGERCGVAVSVDGGKVVLENPRGPDDPYIAIVGAFCMDRYEVTFAEYGACVDAGRCASVRGRGPQYGPRGDPSTRSPVPFSCDLFPPDHERELHPIVCVTLLDAHQYCAYRGGRLPTDVEWHAAALGAGRYGASMLSRPDTSNLKIAIMSEIHDTATVGSYPDDVSKYGARDLLGNVSEWVDVTAPSSGDDFGAVMGAISGPDARMRDSLFATVLLKPADRRSNGTGFRCVYPLGTVVRAAPVRNSATRE